MKIGSGIAIFGIWMVVAAMGLKGGGNVVVSVAFMAMSN